MAHFGSENQPDDERTRHERIFVQSARIFLQNACIILQNPAGRRSQMHAFAGRV
jgi:hypothetical protein